MNESDFYSRLVGPNLDKFGHVVRVENTVGVGCPDVHFCNRGRTAWIELKVAKAGRLVFQKPQIPWMRKHARHGGRACVLFLSEDEKRLSVLHARNLLNTSPKPVGRWVYLELEQVEPLSRSFERHVGFPWGSVVDEMVGKVPMA